MWKSFRDSHTLERAVCCTLFPVFAGCLSQGFFFSFWYIGAPQTHPNNRGESTGVIRMPGMEEPMDRTYILSSWETGERTLPGGPVIKNPPSNAGDAGGETKIPFITGQLSLGTSWTPSRAPQKKQRNWRERRNWCSPPSLIVPPPPLLPHLPPLLPPLLAAMVLSRCSSSSSWHTCTHVTLHLSPVSVSQL